ncbi:hypothetical protein TCSYLVIO_003426 [Trypanosoma cruzi]|nr:hypothetical protein TCSYLVIO_003426 [Trypanosoma cruzi]
MMAEASGLGNKQHGERKGRRIRIDDVAHVQKKTAAYVKARLFHLPINLWKAGERKNTSKKEEEMYKKPTREEIKDRLLGKDGVGDIAMLMWLSEVGVSLLRDIMRRAFFFLSFHYFALSMYSTYFILFYFFLPSLLFQFHCVFFFLAYLGLYLGIFSGATGPLPTLSFFFVFVSSSFIRLYSRVSHIGPEASPSACLDLGGADKPPICRYEGSTHAVG